MVLSDVQRQNVDLTQDLQLEREEREEDHQIARLILNHIKPSVDEEERDEDESIVAKAEERFHRHQHDSRESSSPQTKQQLRDDSNHWKEMHQVETDRCRELGRRIDEQELEIFKLNEQLRTARSRIQDGYRDKQRLGRTILELRPNNHTAATTAATGAADNNEQGGGGGLRELKLLRTNNNNNSPSATTTALPASSPATSTTAKFNKRTSSLGLLSLADNNTTANSSSSSSSLSDNETLLAELVHAKTAEAVAKQELEEVKLKLEGLRKLLTSAGPSPDSSSSSSLSVPPLSPSPSPYEQQQQPQQGCILRTTTEPVVSPGGGGFFSGWGKRVSFRAGP